MREYFPSKKFGLLELAAEIFSHLKQMRASLKSSAFFQATPE